MVFKKKYKILLFAILPIVLLSIIAYNQYQDKKMYEEYISRSVSADTNNIVIAISKSDEIYERALDEGNIARGNADDLRHFSSSILKISQDYGNLATGFNRQGEREITNKTPNIAQEIGFFFSKINEDVDVVNVKNSEEVFALDNQTEVVIKRLKKLNSLWSESILRNVVGVTEDSGKLMFDKNKFQDHYGNNSLSDNYWVDLVADLEKDSRDFLTDNDLTTIKNIFNK